jgi:hypothetical protein
MTEEGRKIFGIHIKENKSEKKQKEQNEKRIVRKEG